MSLKKEIRFEEFILDLDLAELRRSGERIPIEPQVFDLIHFLASRAGTLVTREDITTHVWGGRIVSDAAISSRINSARRALDDDGKQQRLIKTVPRRGFRFADVVLPDAEPAVGEAADEKASLPSRPSIVVLPFRGLSDDAASRELADGLRIDIQNALTKVSSAFIIAAGSANAVRDMPTNQAARTLGVRYALEGSARRSGSQVRFDVALVDAVTDRVAWSDQYDREITDTFELLDDVTARVLTSMNVELVTGDAARIWHKTLKDLRSLETFYRGVSRFFQMNRESLADARQDFEVVARRHPDLSIGPTWAALTHWYDFQRQWSAEPEISKELARDWAEKGAVLEDADGQAHTVLSHVYLLERRFDEAVDAGRQAVLKRPNCTHANGFFANVLHYCGHQQEGLRHIRAAMRFSPFHPPLLHMIESSIRHALGDHEGAQQAIEAAVAANPDDISPRVPYVAILMDRGDTTTARAVVETILRLEPTFSVDAYIAHQPYREAGFLDRMAAQLRKAGLPG